MSGCIASYRISMSDWQLVYKATGEPVKLPARIEGVLISEAHPPSEGNLLGLLRPEGTWPFGAYIPETLGLEWRLHGRLCNSGT